MLLQQNFNRVLIFKLAALNLRQIKWLPSALDFKSSLFFNLSRSNAGVPYTPNKKYN